MGQTSKIEKYKLEGRVMALFQAGKPTAEIADMLTEELAGKDTISQPTVARFLKPIRKETREETRQVVHDHIKKTVESDLEQMDDVQAYTYSEFRREYDFFEDGSKKLRDAKLRIECGLKVCRVIEIKLKYALVDPASGKDTHHPVDLDEFRNDLEDLKGACDGKV